MNLKKITLTLVVLSREPLLLCGLRYFVMISPKYIRIGCENHTHEGWKSFTDEEIAKMDEDALDFLKENKDIITANAKHYQEMCKKD
jgi:hypothetical protein